MTSGPSHTPPGGLDWHFSQVFGERSPGEPVQEGAAMGGVVCLVQSVSLLSLRSRSWPCKSVSPRPCAPLIAADLISAVEFDGTGDYLATGDHGGRVVLFERLGMPGREDGPEGMGGGPRGAPHEYRYLTEFQSHEPEFDYLKSLEIEEKINCVRWVRRGGGWGEGLETPTSHMLLTSNDKTIKLWRVAENPAAGRGDSPIAPPTTAHASAAGHFCATGELRVPSSVRGGGQDLPLLSHRCKRVFSSAHAYHINSVSMSSDQETMLSGARGAATLGPGAGETMLASSVGARSADRLLAVSQPLALWRARL